jgi:hypothetical protein
MDTIFFAKDGKEVRLPVVENSVTIDSDVETFDETPNVTAPLEYHGFDCTLPNSQLTAIERALTVVFPPKPPRPIDAHRYEQMFHRAHSIRKRKRYAKALGYTVYTKGNKVIRTGEKYMYIPRCKLIATLDLSAHRVTLNATAL